MRCNHPRATVQHVLRKSICLETVISRMSSQLGESPGSFRVAVKLQNMAAFSLIMIWIDSHTAPRAGGEEMDVLNNTSF